MRPCANVSRPWCKTLRCANSIIKNLSLYWHFSVTHIDLDRFWANFRYFFSSLGKHRDPFLTTFRPFHIFNCDKRCANSIIKNCPSLLTHFLYSQYNITLLLIRRKPENKSRRKGNYCGLLESLRHFLSKINWLLTSWSVQFSGEFYRICWSWKKQSPVVW